ncbi:MAG TPA: cytochrome c biogenesis protein CcsA [Bacteroidales bacterium]|nr:cytochrome c biogenesis protein CcsA [Bacteroidales bacterium]
MKKLADLLFSYYLMGFVLLAFAVSIAAATFIENDYGTETARAAVYNARWFEVLLFIGIINLSGVIITRKLYRKEKFTIFIFHFSFLVILVGAAITRFFGSEGTMHIREGESSNQIVSEGTYIYGTAITSSDTAYAEKKIIVSQYNTNKYELKFRHASKNITVECNDIIPNAMSVSKESTDGTPLLEIVVAAMSGRETIPFLSGDSKQIGNFTLSFDDTLKRNTMMVWHTDNGLFFKAPFVVISSSMMSQTSDTLQANAIHPFHIKNLYLVGNSQLVAKSFSPSAEIDYVPASLKDQSGLPTAFKLKINVDNESKTLTYLAADQMENSPAQVSCNNVFFSLSVGHKPVQVPFSLKLNKFIVEHYPGSNSPSWFESKITIIDPEKPEPKDTRIYMNNVLQYHGYRFYQSSYDKDEKGTILSVNRDFWGTLVTYLGYILMAAGMLMALFSKNSRFMRLTKELNMLNERKKELSAILILLMLVVFGKPSNLSAQEVPDSVKMNKEQVEKFSQLLVQDVGGRIKPVNSLSSELVRKISRKTTFLGLNSDEVLLSMITHPAYWQTVPMIKFSHAGIAEMLNIKGSYVSFQGLFDPQNPSHYILGDVVGEAYRKKPAYRSKMENELIRLDERANLCYLIYTGDFFRIFPKPEDENNTWYSPENAATAFRGDDSLFVVNAFNLYLDVLRMKPTHDNLAQANEIINALQNFQFKYGKEVIPSDFKRKLETIYNKVNIFDRLSSLYGLVGFVLLILQFIALFKPRMNLKTAIDVSRILIVAGFILHFFGLAARWYISGHAPWSNGYESLIYIAFATILAGIIFSRKTGIALSSTALLAWIILYVAHLSWMDPEITNLVPVLKSYWLMIHVAIITASYGFMALGALLAFLNLIIMFAQSAKNYERIGITISELSAVIEMTLIVGLYLLTIGTFLGGVWANESWGRYWGWDPKETWALVTVLVYAFVAHMRMIPGLRGPYLFNLLAVVTFGCVIMTYFGVNYYLSGLHSYAKGDPLPVPSFVYYTITVIAIVALAAFINQRMVRKSIS